MLLFFSYFLMTTSRFSHVVAHLFYYTLLFVLLQIFIVSSLTSLKPLIHVLFHQWQKISYLADWCHVFHPQKIVLSCYNYCCPVNDIFSLNLLHLSHIMRELASCLCESKDADQLCSNCTADQHLCFRYMASTIPTQLISKILNF